MELSFSLKCSATDGSNVWKKGSLPVHEGKINSVLLNILFIGKHDYQKRYIYLFFYGYFISFLVIHSGSLADSQYIHKFTQSYVQIT